MRTLFLSLLVVSAACSNRSGTLPDGGDEPDGGGPVVPRIDLGGWSVLPEVDGGTKEFLVQVAKAQLGQAADLDLDGLNEVTVAHLPDGTTRWMIQGAGGHRAAMVERSATHQRVTIYFQNAGIPVEIEDSETTGDRVVQYDADHNRTFERVRTEHPVDDGGIEVVEQAVLTDGGFLELARFTLPVSADQGAATGCKGADNIPSDNLLIGGTKGIELQTSGPAACNPTQTTKLNDALQCARDRLKNCVQQSNPELANRVQAALASKSLKVGCGNPCGGADASTEEGFWNSAARMNFNPNSLMTLTPDQLCAVTMHELSHYAGVPRDDHHDDGEDPIYNCARYCAHCVARGPSSGSASKDCVRCASYDGARRACGLDRKLENIECPSLALCHGGIGVNMSCTTCDGIVDYDCNGKKLPGVGFFSCCQACPTDANRVNDKPCPALSASSTCGMMPAGCR
ncbi:MAG: hypothetical protein IPJ65_15660 [Archangiaceae bacterium]|nr:hypothetical protein [Archangiaceae bacterium]